MKPIKKRYRKCKVCNNQFEVNPFYLFIGWCSASCAYEYQNILKANKDKKELNDKCKVWKIDTHAKENKAALQAQINLLARKIDASFDYCCIDCGKEYGKQVDGAHFHSRGANSTLRYHLDNIHSAKSDCNQYSDTHKEGYKKGLVLRYGSDYLAMVEGLPIQYKEVHLSNVEIAEKLKIVRAITRNFHTYSFESSINARNVFNKIINIYQ